MTEALAVRSESWQEQIELIKTTVAKGTTNEELKLFLYTANRTGLDPLLKQIYAVKRWNTKTSREEMSIQVGIDGYRLIADRTGAYAGNDDAVFEQEPGSKFPSKATVTVWKLVAGVRCPFTATARWEQYYPGDKQGFMWGKMPHVMLAKCAEALALRKAFPNELSGVYTNEEMQQADVPLENSCNRCGKPSGNAIVCQECRVALNAEHNQKVLSAPQHTGETITELEATVNNVTAASRPEQGNENRGIPQPPPEQVAEISSDPNHLRLVNVTSEHQVSKFVDSKTNKRKEYYWVNGEDIAGNKTQLICNQPKLFDLVHRIPLHANCLFLVQRTSKDGKPYKQPYITDVLMINGVQYVKGVRVTPEHA